jgi:hypothetical protein
MGTLLAAPGPITRIMMDRTSEDVPLLLQIPAKRTSSGG